MSMEFKFAKSKTIHEANIEGRLYTGRKICQNGQNRLCVSTAISKMASWIFLLFGNLNFVDIPVTNFQVRICWTFFPSELPFPPWVTATHQRSRPKLFHSITPICFRDQRIHSNLFLSILLMEKGNVSFSSSFSTSFSASFSSIFFFQELAIHSGGIPRDADDSCWAFYIKHI